MEWESAEEGEIVSDSEQRNRQGGFEAYMHMNYSVLSLEPTDEQQQGGMAAHESALDTPRIQRFSESEDHDYSLNDSRPAAARSCPVNASGNASEQGTATDLNASTGSEAHPNNKGSRTTLQFSGDSMLMEQKSVVANGTAADRTAEICENESDSEWSGDENGDRRIDKHAESGTNDGDGAAQRNAGTAGESNGVKETWFVVEKGRDPLDLLPEGWIEVRHISGIPVFLHKPTRVCTLSRPYLLGPASVRKHRIPVSAIPCLHYRTEAEKEKSSTAAGGDAPNAGQPDPTTAVATKEQLQDPSTADVPKQQKATSETEIDGDAQLKDDEFESPLSKRARVLTAQECSVQALLSPNQVREYCSRLFEFRCVEVQRFRSWKDRRQHMRQLKAQRYQQLADGDGTGTPDAARRQPKSKTDVGNAKTDKAATKSGSTSILVPCQTQGAEAADAGERASAPKPALPSNTLLIQCASSGPPGASTLAAAAPRKGGAGRPAGEFVINAAGKSFVCILHEYVQHAMRTQPAYRFQELDNAKTPYGATVTIGEREYATGYGDSKKSAKLEAARLTLANLIPEMKQFCTETKIKPTADYEFFDEIRIEDPRLYELSFKAGLPTPYQILDEYIKRNCIGDDKLEMSVKATKNQRSQCSMQLGAFRIKVTCRNKREGKQLAAQTMLKRIYPHLTMWGSVLRMYMPTWRQEREKIEVPLRDERDKRRAEPNHGLIERLKRDMMNAFHDRCSHGRGLHVRGKLRFEVAHAETQTEASTCDQ